MSGATRDEDTERIDYPVYEPEDYQSRDYPLNGCVKVWDPGLRRTIDDSKKSSVPEDSIILEVNTMFVEREYLVPVLDVRTSLVDDRISASHVCLGDSYPGVHVVFPVSDDEYVEYRRSFKEEKEEYRIRDGPVPEPHETDRKVIWVSEPKDQPALADPLQR